MISRYNLSYLLTTFNKIEYLKVTLPELIANCKEDEEIIVIDGGSTDGTKEYLENFYREKKIHQFLSEPDCGEAHGYNKGLLMAKGDLIKIITDDDVFYYDGIQECKNYMMANPEVDIMGGNVGSFSLKNKKEVSVIINDNKFTDWSIEKVPCFCFNGQPLMIRKSQLPLIGLFNPHVIFIDTEFSFKITYNRKLKIGWSPYVFSINITSDKSNSIKFKDIVYFQYKKLAFIYSNKLDETLLHGEKNPVIIWINSTKQLLQYLFKKSINFLSQKRDLKMDLNNFSIPHEVHIDIEDDTQKFSAVHLKIMEVLIEINQKIKKEKNKIRIH